MFSGKKKFDKKQQCSVLFSDICTVSDEAFGRLTIERCWDTWTKECEQKQIQPNVKNLSIYTTNKTNKRFGGWSSAGMKRYDEIAKLVKSDRTFNHQVESLFKDLMITKHTKQKYHIVLIKSKYCQKLLHRTRNKKSDFLISNQ